MARVSLQIILYGDESLSLHDNKRIFVAVHTFIPESDRFAP